MRHFAIQMHYIGDNGSALIFVCLMYGTVIGSTLNQQHVRLYFCVCVIWRCYWHSVQYGRNLTLIMHVLSEYTAMAMMVLR